MNNLRLNAYCSAKIIRSLVDGPCTVAELTQITGLNSKTVGSYVRALIKQGCAHVCAWEKDATGRDSIQVISFGAGVRAQKAKKSNTVLSTEYRARKRDSLLAQAFRNPARPGAPSHQSSVWQ